jgi:hypothetical protein
MKTSRGQVVTEPEQNKPKVVDAEVVRGTSGDAQKSPARFSRRSLFVQSGGTPMDESRLRRMRSRFGMFALAALAIAALFIYLAATVDTVIIAALFLIAAGVAAIVGFFMGWIWRVVGRMLNFLTR